MTLGSTAALTDHAALTRIVARNIGITPQQLTAGLANAAASDFEDVLAFRREHLHVPARWDDAPYLRWRYRFGDGAAGFGELWVLRSGGRLLGILGLEDLQCTLDDCILDGVRSMDLLVRPDLADTGLGPWLAQCTVQHASVALVMGANSNSLGIVRRLYQPLAPRRTFTHPIDARPFAVRRWPRWRAAIALAGPFVNQALTLKDSWRQHAAPRDFRLQPVARFTPAMLPAPTRADAGVVRVSRSAAYLNRRLLENPRRPCCAHIGLQGGSPVGYVVWALGADLAGTPELHVVDWLSQSPRVLQTMLHHAVAEARERGCSCVRVVLQDADEQRVAEMAGFVSARDDPGRVTGVQAKDKALSHRLAQARWALTDATDDADGF